VTDGGWQKHYIASHRLIFFLQHSQLVLHGFYTTPQMFDLARDLADVVLIASK
jgi:hypothetical protein